MSLSREKKSLIFLLIIIAVIVAVAVVVVSSLRTDKVAENIENDQVIKILMVLSDNDGDALATDVFVYYPKSQKAALFDILAIQAVSIRALEELIELTLSTRNWE